MLRLLIASPHRYPDLARLWHRLVLRELVPAFDRRALNVEVNVFCDANRDQFLSYQFPGVRFSSTGPAMRDFMQFYDATLHAECDYLLFLDADTFVLDGDWASSYFDAFDDAHVAAISYVPRKGAPAIFALACRTKSFRALPTPAFACRYEFPSNWPRGVNLQPGDFAVRELASRGARVINIDGDESSRHTVNFRGTTGFRALREHMTRSAGEAAFFQFVAANPLLLVAGYDNVLLGCLYEALYREPFAPDLAGRPLGASLTIAELSRALKEIRDAGQIKLLEDRFQLSKRNILRMAAHEGVKLEIPPELAATCD